MYTIDLLKGAGVPIRSSGDTMVTTAVSFSVPFVIAMVLVCIYLTNQVNIAVAKNELKFKELKYQKISTSISEKENFEKQTSQIKLSIQEVASVLGKYTQWTPILVEVVKNIPASMILDRMEVKQHFIRKKVPKKNDPEKTQEISVPVRRLLVTVKGVSSQNCDADVRDYRERLWSSAQTKKLLEDIRVSHQSDSGDDAGSALYILECIFKAGL